MNSYLLGGDHQFQETSYLTNYPEGTKEVLLMVSLENQFYLPFVSITNAFHGISIYSKKSQSDTKAYFSFDLRAISSGTKATHEVFWMPVGYDGNITFIAQSAVSINNQYYHQQKLKVNVNILAYRK